MAKIVIDGVIFEIQNYGGISRVYHEICPHICQLDESIRFDILTTGKLKQTLPQHPHIRHHSLNYWEMLFKPGRFFRQARWRGRCRAFLRWLQRNQVNIWHSTYYTLPIGWHGPVVITVYDLIYNRFPHMFKKPQDEWIRSHMRLAIMAADVVICISATTRENLMQLYAVDTTKLRVIPLGVAPVFRQIQAANLPDVAPRPFLLFVGQRGGYKNFTTLLQAYSRWSLRSEIDLLVVGTPWTKAEAQQLQDSGVAAQVRLVTAVSDQTLANLYNQAAAFVYPSLYEGFGLPLLEAMACGCPLVASAIPSSMEVAADAAYFFEPESVEALLAALDRAVGNGRSAPRVQKGIAIAAAYTWQKTARQTLEVYYELI